MNAIISLCHFCADIHGPTILLCTQTFHAEDPQLEVNKDNSEVHYLKNRKIKSEKFNEGTCESCESLLDDKAGYITSDCDVAYISTRQSEQAAVYSFVKNACVRSLSSEVCAGREGPIFYGDEMRGNVISYAFSLSDKNARGGQRHFSILVLMVDRIYLLNSWTYITARLSSIVQYLKEKVATKETLNYISERSHSSRTPVTSTKPESLANLIGNENIYQYLHCEFTSLLRYGGRRIREVLYEGRATEDSMIRIQNANDETEEGFIKLEPIELHDDSDPAAAAGHAPHDGVADAKRCERLRYLAKMLDIQTFRLLLHYLLIGHQVIIRGRNEYLVRSVIDCLENLIPKGCCHTIPFSSEYNQHANILGIHNLCKFKDGDIDLCDVILDVEVTQDAGVNYQGVKVALSPYREIASPEPQLLQRIVDYLFNDTLTDAMLHHCLTSVKLEWINKAKVYFNFCRDATCKSNSNHRKLLTIMKARECDVVMLTFWMTGLSETFKTHLNAADKPTPVTVATAKHC